MSSITRTKALMLCAAVLPAPAWAEGALAFYDRVEFTVTASSEIATDNLVAYLSRQMEGDGAGALSDQVNKAVSQAIKLIKQSPEIKAESAGYETTPLYQDERLVGWRVRQSIRVESGNFARLSALLGDLQQNLNLDGINYEVTPESMRRAEDSLTEQALASFQQRAEKITRGLGRARYRIITMRITNPILPIQPGMMGARSMAAAPNLEPNEKKVQVSVTGTIELQTD